MRLSSLLLVPALVCALVGPGLTGCSADVRPRATAVLAGSAGQADEPAEEDTSREPGQTSEGIRGEMVEPYPDGVLPRPRVSDVEHWRIVPGVTYREWKQTDRRGPIRAHLLQVKLSAPGVSVDYAQVGHVPDRDTTSALLRTDKAIGGVNGGFFDIHDTGAPLGVGVDKEAGFLHASRYTWNNALYLTRNGTPRIGKLKVAAQIDQYPQMEITNVNSPRVRVANIGLYTSEWGSTFGYRITDGQKKQVRMVVIQGGRVVANRTSLTAGREIEGDVLIGRGPGAAQLRQLRVGSMASVSYRLPPGPRMAISGEKVLLRDGRKRVSNDRELHPRTAVGIDRSKNKLLLLVVDGRSRRSRGYTMVEMARMMRSLGADDALNFDGGGSSTLVGTGRSGAVKVMNRPSDGSQRSVGDALGITYSAPVG